MSTNFSLPSVVVLEYQAREKSYLGTLSLFLANLHPSFPNRERKEGALYRVN